MTPGFSHFRYGARLLARQVPQHILENAAGREVVQLIFCVDAATQGFDPYERHGVRAGVSYYRASTPLEI